jgi:hypothetical protein
MVPVESNTTGTNVMMHDIYRALTEQTKAVDENSVEGAFIGWMNDYIVNSTFADLTSDFAVTNYRQVARLSFLMELNSFDHQNWENSLNDGLHRVSGRSITLPDTEPAPFLQDAVALLGLALGAKRIGGDTCAKVLQWMRSFLQPSDKTVVGWKRVFYLATLAVVGEVVDIRDLQDLSQCDDIKLAFVAKGINIFGDIDVNLAYQAIYDNTIIGEQEPELAACRLLALKHLSTKVAIVSMNTPTVQQVVDLLDRIPSGLKRWPWEEKPKTSTSTTQKWDIQNEYHVQSLVYSILAPIFPDIEDEFYFEPVGQLNPRADIGLPSLHLIIEIKFLRSGVTFNAIIEQVAADASLYFKKNSIFTKKYSQMIVLLWDNSFRNQHHHEFKKGISTLSNVVGAVVVSRPGNMILESITGQKKIGLKRTPSKKKD